jgi:hypothetical protein
MQRPQHRCPRFPGWTIGSRCEIQPVDPTLKIAEKCPVIVEENRDRSRAGFRVHVLMIVRRHAFDLSVCCSYVRAGLRSGAEPGDAGL